jgi:BirA family biotin operon repressor/biotin-[acetyl-CoA-carboxylase] ligase
MQTSGRGRLGRSFYSPERTGLYFTVTIPLNFPLEDITLLTPAAAVAVHRILSKLTDKKLSIKWVNDIYCENKKICGILAEALTDTKTNKLAAVAVGIGINLSTKDFPDDISDIASSLSIENADKNKIAADIANELFAFAENISAREFIPEYRASSCVTGKNIYFIQGEQKQNARALDIDEDGGLVVLLESGETTTLRGGEISVRIK